MTLDWEWLKLLHVIESLGGLCETAVWTRLILKSQFRLPQNRDEAMKGIGGGWTPSCPQGHAWDLRKIDEKF